MSAAGRRPVPRRGEGALAAVDDALYHGQCGIPVDDDVVLRWYQKVRSSATRINYDHHER